MNMRRFCLVALMALASAGMVAAQEGGMAALPFTRIDRNPRSSAFAGGGRASVGAPGAWQAFGAAASLPFMEGMVDGALGFQLWEPNNEVDQTINIQGGAAVKFGSIGIALGGAYQSGIPNGDFTPSDRLVSLGFAYGIGQRISLGLNARYAAQSLAKDISFSGFSFDLAVLGKITRELSATLGVSTLGTPVASSGDTPFGQPTYAFAGLAWRQLFGTDHALEGVLDGEYGFDGQFAGSVGAEYAFRNLVFVRAGYRLAGEYALLPSHLSLGLGFSYAGFRLDASFLTLNPMLGNTFSVAAGYRF